MKTNNNIFLVIGILIFFQITAFGQIGNPYANAINVLPSNTFAVDEEVQAEFSIGNSGDAPIPAGGALFNFSFPSNVTVDQASLDLDGGDAIFSEAWASDGGITYLQLSVVGAGIPAKVFNGPQTDFIISVNITGQTIGSDGLTSNVLPNGDNGNPSDDNGFIPITVTAPLPVTLLNFNAQAVDNDTKLTWKTASELNNSHFELERSLDGKNFEKIGQVKGYGTTSAEQSYEFFDRGIGNEVNGFVYYRLKQVDFDGKFEYSEPRRVLFNGFEDGGFTLFPNPIMGTSKLLVAGSNYGEILIYNALGQLIAEYDATEAKQRIIDIEALAPGTYYVHSEKGQIEKLIVH